MLVDDLVVEIRDASFNRVGRLMPQDLVGSTFVTRHNDVGSWQVKLPEGSPLADALRSPGAGISVVGPDNSLLFSGFTTSAKLSQTPEDLAGVWEISGLDDNLILAERLAYPTPTTDDVTAQISAYDVRSGAAETVIKGFVSANIGPDAPISREISYLTIEPDLERGPAVNASARFQTLQEVCYSVAQYSNLGFRLIQDGDTLDFQVYEPTDLSEFIRLDVENRSLSQANYNYASPRATHVIVAGAGEAEDRLFIERTTEESETAEILWGRRVEIFKDARGSDTTEELEQEGDALLADNGKTLVTLDVSPADTPKMTYGIDWFLGDLVTVVAGPVEAVAVVTEVGIAIGPDGVLIRATTGTPSLDEFESKLVSTQKNHESRISNLERSTTGYGINTAYQPEGGTDGTQPTFSGPAIFGTFNRIGNLVHFSILVDFDNITSFGTGQYYLTLPYPARVAYQFRDGCLHDDSAGTEYQVSGHVFAGEDQLLLNIADKVSSGVQDVPFTSTVPVTLTTADSFHIAGLYEIEE